MVDESRSNLLQPDTVVNDLESGNGPNRQASPQSNMVRDYFQQSSHPVAAFFFLAFRLGAFLMYLFGSLFTDNFALVFVITILLLAFDFWTVKNVSGRLLVGLRWWNEIQEDGSNKWVFESANPNRKINAADSRLFWTTLYVTPISWIILAITSLFTVKLKWFVIVVVAIILTGANVYGYTQCDKDAKKKWATGIAAQGALGSLGSSATGLVGKAVGSGIGRLFGTR